MALFSRKTETPEPLMDNTVYLIDTENVRTVWTLLLDRMTENDKIYVFYTMNSGNVSYEDLNGVISSGKNVELIQCHTGKNGLDFQLVSYLGYLIKSNENADYCIISDDSGYDAVLKFWEGRDVDVTRKTAAQVSGKPVKGQKKPLFGAKKPRTAKSASSKSSAPRQSEAKTSATIPAAPKPVATKSAVAKPATPKSTAASPATAKTVKPANVSEDPTHSDKSLDTDKLSANFDAEPAADVSDAIISKLREFLPDEPDEKLVLIAGIVKKSGGRKGLADIHDEIEKLYRNESASEVYRIVRHNISDIYL